MLSHYMAGFVFRACGLGCPQTCDNYKSLREDPSSCDLSQVDGCFCPDGQVSDTLLITVCWSHAYNEIGETHVFFNFIDKRIYSYLTLFLLYSSSLLFVHLVLKMCVLIFSVYGIVLTILLTFLIIF
jgi:hypothetical protein